MEEQNILNIERVALEWLLEERKKQGLTETEFGRLAFPELENPRGKINSIYQGKTASGKGLRLRLGDYCAMCKALGKNPPEELFRLWNSVENG